MKRFFALAVSLVMLAVACTKPSAEVQEPYSSPQPRPEPFSPGALIVELSEDLADALGSGTPTTKSNAFTASLEPLGLKSVERLYPDAGEWEPRHRAAGLHRWFRIEYDPRYAAPTKAAGDMLNLPGVVSAEPERRVRRASFFNDPYADKQWALYNDGSLGLSFERGCDINVHKVWSSYTAGTSNVIVAVIDEGVQLSHEDLVNSTIPAGRGGSYSFVFSKEGSSIISGNHGTHVAGIIGATSNNGIGISGVAGGYDGNGGVRLLCCEVFRDNPEDKEHLLQGNIHNALVWAADNGAVIANNSWSYVFETEEEAIAGNVGSVSTAIDYFINYAGCDANGRQRPDSPMKGGLVVFSAGNDAYSMAWPAAYEPVIAVGAFSALRERSSYSNYGDWVDICAPGGDREKGSQILSTVNPNGYGSFQGTSMACPHVSGVAALLVSYYGGQGFTCEMLKKKLLEGATTRLAPKDIGPMLNAYGSFASGGTTPPEPVPSFEVSASSNFVLYRWGVTPDEDDGKAFSFHLLASKDKDALLAADLSKGIPDGFGYAKVETGESPVGGAMSGVVSGLEFNTLYYVAIVAADYNKNYSAISPVKEIVTGGNLPPVLSPDDGTRFSLKSHETITCHFSAFDPDGHVLYVECEPGSDALTATIENGTITVVIRGADAPSGKYSAVVTASDGFGGRASCRVEYEILPNHAPVVVGQIDNQLIQLLKSSVPVRVKEYFYDEDGEELEYRIEIGNKKVVSQTRNGEIFFLISQDYGISDVTVYATDIRGETAVMSFIVLVDDGSHDVKLYPNPVQTVLNIWVAAAGPYEVTVSNKAGATVLSGSFEIGPFTPAAIDLSGRPSGIYSVRLKGNGTDELFSVAKL